MAEEKKNIVIKVPKNFTAKNDTNLNLITPALYSRTKDTSSFNIINKNEHNHLVDLPEKKIKKTVVKGAEVENSNKSLTIPPERFLSPIYLESKSFNSKSNSDKTISHGDTKSKIEKEYSLSYLLKKKTKPSIASNDNLESKKYKPTSPPEVSQLFRDRESDSINTKNITDQNEILKLKKELAVNKDKNIVDQNELFQLKKELEVERGKNVTDQNELLQHKRDLELSKDKEIMLQQQIQSLKKNLLESKKLEDEVLTLKEEKKTLKESMEHSNRIHFNEMKNLYEKYIAVQSALDKDKLEANLQKQNFKEAMLSKEQECERYQSTIKHMKIEHGNELQNFQLKEKSVSETFESMKKKLEYYTRECENNNHEKNHLHIKLKESMEQLNTTNKYLTEKNLRIQELEVLFSRKEEELKNLSLVQGKENNLLEGKIDSLTENIKQEHMKNKNLQDVLVEKQEIIYQLDKKLRDGELMITDINKLNGELSEAKGNIKKLEEKLSCKENENTEMLNTNECLRKSNQHLNIRYKSLQDINTIRNDACSNFTENEMKLEKLVHIWQQKVYQFMVLIKTHELDCPIK